MNPKRTLGLYAAVSSLLLCVVAFWWIDHVFFVGVPHASHSGERLGFATFRPNEFIRVKSAHGDRGVQLRVYRFYWVGGDRYVDVSGNTDPSDTAMTPLAGARKLTGKEADGLDAMVSWFRTRGEERAAGVGRYQIAYFRNNQPIGEEVFIGYRMPRELAYFRKVAGTSDAEPANAYDQIALEASLTGAELDRVVPFEQLESASSAP